MKFAIFCPDEIHNEKGKLSSFLKNNDLSRRKQQLLTFVLRIPITYFIKTSPSTLFYRQKINILK